MPNVLTEKLGPAPRWVWAVAAAGVVFLYIKRKGAAGAASSSADQSAAGQATTPDGYDGQGSGYQGSLGSTGEDFSAVNQNLTRINATLAQLVAKTAAGAKPKPKPKAPPVVRHERPPARPALRRPPATTRTPVH